MSLGSLILWCTNWSQLTFVTSTVTWAWADREAARAKMATKATQTHFRGIRLSSQEIAIFANDPSVVPILSTAWKAMCWCQYSGAKMGGTPDVGGKSSPEDPARATFSPAFCGLLSSIFCGHGGCLLPRLRACRRKGTYREFINGGSRAHAHHHQSLALGIGADTLGGLR